MSEHQALLSLGRWVLIQGVRMPLPSPCKVCASDAKMDLRPEGRGQGTQGRAAPPGPRGLLPKRGVGGPWGEQTQPPHCGWSSGRPRPSAGGVA